MEAKSPHVPGDLLHFAPWHTDSWDHGMYVIVDVTRLGCGGGNLLSFIVEARESCVMNKSHDV